MNFIKNAIMKRIPDKFFLEYKYKRIFKDDLRLNNPQTFNEKLQWLGNNV